MRNCGDCKQNETETEFYAVGSYCKPCHRKRSAAWSAKNSKRKLEINRNWRGKHHDRRRIMLACSNAFWTAIRQGKINRGTECTFCGATENIEGAHTDYDKPLEVIWLCRSCHRIWDAKDPKTSRVKKKSVSEGIEMGSTS